MDNTLYNNVKSLLISEAKEIKRLAGNDKGMLNYELNNSLDRILRDFKRKALISEKITQRQYDLYSNWLTNLTIKFHA